MNHPPEWEVSEPPNLYDFCSDNWGGEGVLLSSPRCNLMNKCLNFTALSPFVVFRRWGGIFVYEEVGGVSVFRRLRSDWKVDSFCTNLPRTRPLGTEASLSIFRPHVLNNISGRDSAEDPSLLDKRMEIDSQPSGGWLGWTTVCDISSSESNAAFVLPRRQAEQCSTASVPRKSWPRQEDWSCRMATMRFRFFQ